MCMQNGQKLLRDPKKVIVDNQKGRFLYVVVDTITPPSELIKDKQERIINFLKVQTPDTTNSPLRDIDFVFPLTDNNIRLLASSIYNGSAACLHTQKTIRRKIMED
uniref:Uncharacterized protein n=1 Tax=Panagrolaimus sp. ES5 TaxID=591445 RepID=A0AC34G5L2_9BILA